MRTAPWDELTAALVAYRALPRKQLKARLKPSLLLDYRCRDNCLLLYCWQSPAGRLVYLPQYKLSPNLNARTSVPAARQKRTSDGDRRWLDRVTTLAEFTMLGAAGGAALKCDHVDTVATGDVLAAHVEQATPGRPFRQLFPV